MNCRACGRPIADDARFCSHCGAAADVRCPACGASNAADHNFCRACGERLTPAAVPAVDTVIGARAAREGERKHVTVLLADIKGSMELLAGRDPEEAREVLDPVLRHMIEAVQRYEGVVNQVMGDGIMALFGAPIAHEDHALRACYAALRMQDALREAGSPVQLRVGINSGEVVVRAIGSDVDVDYTAVGETTHLAARFEQHATPGSVLLGPGTLALVEGFVEVRPLGPQTVKGRAAPIELYELRAIRRARTRLQARVAQAWSPLVGRTGELAVVERARERAAEHRGQVVAVVGEAGVGKSRFVWEFVRSCEREGWRVLETGCVSYGRRAPYLPVAGLLRAVFAIGERHDFGEARRRVEQGVVELDAALVVDRAPLLALLDLDPEDGDWRALDPPRRRQRTIEAVKRLVLRVSQAAPLVLVVEDLHWVDSETQAVLDALVEALPGARMLLLVNYRPEYRHAWSGKSYYREVHLDPLGAQGGEALLDALLGADPGLRELKRRLLEQTEGNPFFLEESVRALADTGTLHGPPGARRLAGPVTTADVPATVQAVLAARIDRLPPEDKRVLQCAAVIGKDVPLVLLEAVADLPGAALRAALARLQASEFLYEAQLFPDLVYTFRHALTHEVTYHGLLGAQRRALHARIARATLSLYAGRLAEHAERLSHHALRGELWDLAVTYGRQAAARSAALCVDHDAGRLYERALEALARLPEGSERDALDIDLRLQMRTVLWRSGRVDRLVSLFADAEAVATRLGDARRLNAVYAFLLQYHWAIGEYEPAKAFGARCLQAAEALGDPALAIVGNLYLGHVHYVVGEFRRAVELLQRNIDLLGANPTVEQPGISGLPYAMSCAWSARALVEVGDFSGARRLVALGDAAARRAAHAYSLAAVEIAGGAEIAMRGDATAAVAALEPLLALCRERHFVGWVIVAGWYLTIAYLEAGRTAEALAVCREALALKTSTGARTRRGAELALLAEALAANDRLDEARSAATEAVEIASAQGEVVSEGLAHIAVARVAAASSPPSFEGAEAAMARGLTLLERCSARPAMARAQLALGTRYAAWGLAEQARQSLEAAARAFRDLDMTVPARHAEEALARGASAPRRR